MTASFPVPRQAEQVVREWAEPLAERFGVTVDALRSGPARLIDFPNETVRIDLMDDSRVEFKSAFFVVSEPLQAVAVFTEHCGHHVFPLHDSKVFRDGVVVYEDKARGFREAQPKAGQ